MNHKVTLKKEKYPAVPIGGWEGIALRANPRPLIWVTLAVMLVFLWIARTPYHSMVGVFYLSFFPFGCLPIILLRKWQIDEKIKLEKRLGLEPNLLRTESPFRFWFVPIVAVTWLCLYAQFPMTFAFRYSRPSLDRIADEALADPSYAERFTGQWAGLYSISKVEVIGKTVVLYTSGFEKDCWGFARAPDALAAYIYHIPERFNESAHPDGNFRDFPPRSGFHDPTGKRIMGDWFVVYSSYWYHKLVHED